jgi:hypothetical protein
MGGDWWGCHPTIWKDGISLYLTEATAVRHSREWASYKPSWCTFSLISHVGFPDFKINFNIFQERVKIPDHEPLDFHAPVKTFTMTTAD